MLQGGLDLLRSGRGGVNLRHREFGGLPLRETLCGVAKFGGTKISTDEDAMLGIAG